MRALVINLLAEVERMAFQAEQLQRLGIGFERLEAVTPSTVTPAPDDPYWTGWERPLRTTEMAAFTSHLRAWEAVADSDAPRLILEDDAVLMPGVPGLLALLDDLPEAEFVTLETRGRRKRISPDPHSGAPIHRLWQDRTGAAAYVLWPKAARKLVARASAAPGLADAMLCAAYDLSAWQAVPALACQLDHCRAAGFEPPLATESAIGREARPQTRRNVAQRMRRVSAQLRMGLRALAHIRADNVIVPLRRD